MQPLIDSAPPPPPLPSNTGPTASVAGPGEPRADLASGRDLAAESGRGPSTWFARVESSHVTGLVVAGFAGPLLGIWCQSVAFGTMGEWTMLAEVASLWVGGAFAIGWWSAGRVTRLSTLTSAVLGAVLLISATLGYYATTPTPFPAQTVPWLEMSLVAGSVFGACGRFVRSGHPAIRLIAAGTVWAGSLLDVVPSVLRGMQLSPQVMIVLALVAGLPFALAVVPDDRPVHP